MKRRSMPRQRRMKTRTYAAKLRRMWWTVTAALALLCAGCSWLGGTGAPPPGVAAAAAGAIVAYPAGVRACMELARPDDRELCVELARDGLDEAVDAELEQLAALAEGSVKR